MKRKGPWKGTDSRRSDVLPVVSFPPSFAHTFSSRERHLGTRQLFSYESSWGPRSQQLGEIPGPARLLMTTLWLFTYPQLPSFFSKAPLELLSFPVFFFLTLLSPASSQLAFHSSVQVAFSSACSFPAATEILGIFLLVFCALLVLSQISTRSKYYCNFHLTVEDC